MAMTKPFQVEWSKEAVDAVVGRARYYEFPPAPEADGWRYGCDPAFLKDLCDYWLNAFDAQGAAALLNRYPQSIVQIEDIDIHAVHVVGEAEGRRPLLLVHGWPGSVFEFWKVIDALAYPSRHGGRAEDAFDLVIPSLPGYGCSGRPKNPVGVRTTARLFDTLMRDGFGYRTYFAQGGDWGAGVCAWLALDHPGSMRAIHLNYLLVQPDAEPETNEEKAWKQAFDASQQALGGYSHLQGTKPQSLAYAMAGNPVAQAAWIVERFHDWADLRSRRFEDVFTRDQLLTDIMIYVMNDAFVPSTWYYAGAAAEAVRKMPKGRSVLVPTGFAAYPDPRAPMPPRSWVERGYAISHWAEPPRGGHFAAMEEPEFFVDDLCTWAGASA